MVGFITLILRLLLHGEAIAGEPVANAGEIPVLADLLQRTGWSPTPELTGTIRVGDIFATTGQGEQWQGEGCLSSTPRVSPYTQVDLTSQLESGVRVRFGLGQGGTESGISRKMRFGAPTHHALPGMALDLSPPCVETLRKMSARGADLHSWYVVKEVLMAEITEQSCGRVDAGGSFVGLGGAEVELAQACSQTTQEPVAVAWRTVGVVELDPSLVPTSLPRSDGLNSVPGASGSRTTGGAATLSAPAEKPKSSSRTATGTARSAELRTDGFYLCEIPVGIVGIVSQPASILVWPDGRAALGSALTVNGLYRNYSGLRANPDAATALEATGGDSFLLLEPGAEVVIHPTEGSIIRTDWTWRGLNKINGSGVKSLPCPFVEDND